MGKYIMALDQGTTSSRTILFDKKGNIVCQANKEFEQIFPKPGWVEHNPEEIWMTQLLTMEDVMRQAQITGKDIEAIGITNQRETTVVWDKNTGKPIYNAIVWQCRRTSDIVDGLVKDGLRDFIRNKTGLVPDAYFSGTKIKWILDNVPGARNKAENGQLLFGTIDSWLMWKLSGGSIHATDYTNAGRTMIYNIFDLEWDQELLDILDIPKSMLPKVNPSSGIFGYTMPELLGERIPISGVAGDQQAALFGQCCFEKGDVKNTYGTGGFMLMNTGDKIVESKNGLLSTVAWQIGNQVNYALEGSIFVSGSLMKWLRDQLQLFENTKDTQGMAESVENTNGVYIVPAFVGLGAPYWDDACQATILGLTFGANKNHIVRAALESMAYQSKDVLEAMKQDSQIEISSLKVDGGAAANNFLLQFQSDLLQMPVQRFKTNELTALGAAYLAGLSCGYWTQDELGVDLQKEFVPKKSDEEMDSLYSNWKKAVKTCQSYK